LTDISVVRTASFIKAMMEADSTSETSEHFNVTTGRYNPEDFKLHTGSTLLAFLFESGGKYR
jgi:hypothetical protein